jgi:hypothetical protein
MGGKDVPHRSFWFEPGRDEVRNPGLGFSADARPSGVPPGSPGTAPARQMEVAPQNSVGDSETNSKSHSWVLCVVGTDRKNVKV